MKLSDYVIQFLADQGVGHVFCISGHGNLHLIDSLGKHSQVRHISTQHEQAAATAAEAYSKITGNLGAALVTTGPGGTNTITGVASAWLDSVPVIYISGQVNRNESIRDTKVRQFGVQEINIIDIVRPITKYAVTVTDPEKIRYHLERALYESKTGRPGPVWLDIPLDVSHSEVTPDEQSSFTDAESVMKIDDSTKKKVSRTIELLAQAERPVIMAGAGIKRSDAKREFKQLVEALNIPVLCTYSGADLMPWSHPLSMGRLGINGIRSANFTVQNADLVLSIGSRLNTTITSSRPETFARQAKKIVVDIDENELNKNWIKIDLAINVDAKLFIQELLNRLETFQLPDISEWIRRCQDWKEKYPPVLPEYHDLKDGVNSFVFIDTLSNVLEEDDVYIHDMGSSFSCSMQTFKVKPGQFVSSNYGMAGMGYFLPAAIGSWFGSKEQRRVVCVCGDGGMQMAIWELQTLAHYNIPLKIFILNNHCYLTIKHSQDTYFDGNLVDSTPDSGYSAPDFLEIAQAYGLKTASIKNQKNLSAKVKETLETPGPVICDVLMPDDQPLIPKMRARVVKGRYVTPPLEDMYPFLPREEFLENMIIDPLRE